MRQRQALVPREILPGLVTGSSAARMLRLAACDDELGTIPAVVGPRGRIKARHAAPHYSGRFLPNSGFNRASNVSKKFEVDRCQGVFVEKKM